MNDSSESLHIAQQGSFAVGGTVLREPGTYDPCTQAVAGQTLHGDHAHVFFQVPTERRGLPLVMLHGGGQFSKTWQTTPDGREGFQNLFLRHGHPVYLVDQPRRAGAGLSTLPVDLIPKADNQRLFDHFRLGVWPDFFPGVQFSQDSEALNQYFRQITPDTGPFDLDVISNAMSALFDKIGPSVLFTHSQGGGPGWLTAMKNATVRGIVCFEPGSNFFFPHGEVPAPMACATSPLEAFGVAEEAFDQLTKIPILVIYGDNIPSNPVSQKGLDHWRVRLSMAKRWEEAVNRRGGDAKVVHLPALGITGNTHFPFSDLNSLQVADLVADFLSAKGLHHKA